MTCHTQQWASEWVSEWVSVAIALARNFRGIIIFKYFTKKCVRHDIIIQQYKAHSHIKWY